MASNSKSKLSQPKSDLEFVDESPSRDCLRRARIEDGSYMTVLGKYAISSEVYEIVESRLDAMYDSLLDGVEYFPEELVCGNPVRDRFPGLDGAMETVLCLKHMATLPDARIVELQWDTFAVA